VPSKKEGFHTEDFIRLRELPYLHAWPNDDRGVVVMPYHRGAGEINTYIGAGGDQLIVMKSRAMPDGTYIGVTHAADDDIALPLSTVVLQHFSAGDVLARSREIVNDLENAMASVHKYFVFLRHANLTDDYAVTAWCGVRSSLP